MPSCILRHALERCLKHVMEVSSLVRRDIGEDQESLGERLSKQERHSTNFREDAVTEGTM